MIIFRINMKYQKLQSDQVSLQVSCSFIGQTERNRHTLLLNLQGLTYRVNTYRQNIARVYSQSYHISCSVSNKINVTHQFLCCTLQCRWSGKHSLHPVSCSGRSHPLHLLCGSYVPPYYLCLCRNPSCCFDWELGFHWDRTSFQRNQDGCNKSLGQFCRAVPYPLHQCPPGSQDCCCGMLCLQAKTTDFFHLGRIQMIYVQETCLNVILNALEETTLAYVLVTDKSSQFYEPRKC